MPERPAPISERAEARFGILARHLLAVFSSHFAAIFLACHLFIGLATTLAFSFDHPYVPLGSAIAALPDLILLALPISLPFVTLIAAVSSLSEAQRHSALLWIELSGRDPRRLMLPILVAGALASLAAWWLNAQVVPRAHFHTRFELTSVRNLADTATLRLGRDAEFRGRFDLQFRSVENEQLIAPRVLIRSRSNTAITAQRARVGVSDDHKFLDLFFDHGRLVQVDDRSDLVTDLSFDRLHVQFDADRISGPTKQEILDPKYYTNSELSRFPDLIDLYGRSGLLWSTRQRTYIFTVPAVRLTRVQSALLPVLFVSLAVALLGRHRATRRTRMFVLVFCLGVLLPQQLLLEIRARNVGSLALWKTLLPTVEVVAVLAFAWIRNLRRLEP